MSGMQADGDGMNDYYEQSLANDNSFPDEIGELHADDVPPKGTAIVTQQCTASPISGQYLNASPVQSTASEGDSAYVSAYSRSVDSIASSCLPISTDSAMKSASEPVKYDFVVDSTLKSTSESVKYNFVVDSTLKSTSKPVKYDFVVDVQSASKLKSVEYDDKATLANCRVPIQETEGNFAPNLEDIKATKDDLQELIKSLAKEKEELAKTIAAFESAFPSPPRVPEFHDERDNFLQVIHLETRKRELEVNTRERSLDSDLHPIELPQDFFEEQIIEPPIDRGQEQDFAPEADKELIGILPIYREAERVGPERVNHYDGEQELQENINDLPVLFAHPVPVDDQHLEVGAIPFVDMVFGGEQEQAGHVLQHGQR